MAQQGPNHEQGQPVPDTQPGIFTWLNIRWFLAEFLSKSMIFIGAITSATGGFKGIPILLTLYPLSLIAIPSAIVTMLCVISAISGFTVFWSSYIESLTPYCYKFIDFIKNILTFNWSFEEPEPRIPSSPDTQSTLDKHIKECNDLSEKIITETETKKILSKYVLSSLYSLRVFLGEERYQELETRYVEAIHKKAEQEETASEPEEIPDEPNTFAIFLHNALQALVKFLSILLVIFGSFVVVGIGILTNQGFFDYAGISVGGYAMTFCVVAAVMKQICQLCFSGEKQYHTICSFFEWFGIKIDSENDQDRKVQKKKKEIEKNKAELADLTACTLPLTILKEELDAYYEQSNKLQEPITFLRERRALLNAYQAMMPPAPTSPVAEANNELEIAIAERRDAIMDNLFSSRPTPV